MRGEVTTVARSNAHYGWVPDLPDQRDFLYAAPPAVVVKLPRKVDLTSQCPPVYDQGQLAPAPETAWPVACSSTQ